jgi:hypothetical protein
MPQQPDFSAQPSPNCDCCAFWDCCVCRPWGGDFILVKSMRRCAVSDNLLYRCGRSVFIYRRSAIGPDSCDVGDCCPARTLRGCASEFVSGGATTKRAAAGLDRLADLFTNQPSDRTGQQLGRCRGGDADCDQPR